ncbi:MAG: hypothetical protein ACREBR_05775 [bacterium]
MATMTLHASGAETTSGSGIAMNVGANRAPGMFVSVTAVSGLLVSLIVTLQVSPDGNIWANVPDMTTASLIGVGNVFLAMPNSLNPDWIRCIWTISGLTPSFTFQTDLLTF